MIVLDTTILFSGFLARRAESPPTVLLRRALRGELPLLLSPALWSEYVRVLGGPRLASAMGASPDAVTPALGRLWSIAQVVTPRVGGPPAPDPKDQHLWDLLAAMPDSRLVTGEKRLLSSTDFPGRLLSPNQAVEVL